LRGRQLVADNVGDLESLLEPLKNRYFRTVSNWRFRIYVNWFDSLMVLLALH